MQKDIRNALIKLARLKTPWTYSQLNEQLQLGLNFRNEFDRVLIGEWLGEISIHAFRYKRPLLSSLIIHNAKDREQGDGFYKLCENFYNIPWQQLKDNKEFELEKMKECYSFWRNDDNFHKFKNDY